MPDAMDLVDAAMIASGFLGAAVIVWGALKATGKGVMRLERSWASFRREWEGQPARDGEPAVPGVMARLGTTEHHLGQQDIHLARQDEHADQQDAHMAAQDKALEQIKTQLAALQGKPGSP